MDLADKIKKVLDSKEDIGQIEEKKKVLPKISIAFGLRKVLGKGSPKKPNIKSNEELIPVYENGYLVDYEIVSREGYKVAGRDYADGWQNR